MMLTKNLTSHFKRTNHTSLSLPIFSQSPSVPTSRIVNISARVGSISDNHLGGWYSYRISKAALNMFTKTLSIEMKKHQCCVISLHPGTTDTDLSKPFQKNVKPIKLFSTSYSVEQMLNVISTLDMSKSGKFYGYDGSEIEF